MISAQNADVRRICQTSICATPIVGHPLVGRVQVVAYEAAPTPALVLGDGGEIERLPLTPGVELDYSLGERHCAGVVQNGRHDRCENARAPKCDDHTVPWSVANNADSEEEHAVYLAAFAPDVFKVGVTRSWRLDTRLREQGADRAAHVYTVDDGRVAREVESEIAERIPDRVRIPTKVAGLHRSVEEAEWEKLVAEFDPLDTFAFDYGLSLDEQPVPETLAAGTVVGVQGRVLVVDNRGTRYAVNLRDLVGYELDDDGEPRELQSSLGVFG